MAGVVDRPIAVMLTDSEVAYYTVPGAPTEARIIAGQVHNGHSGAVTVTVTLKPAAGDTITLVSKSLAAGHTLVLTSLPVQMGARGAVQAYASVTAVVSMILAIEERVRQ